MTLPRRRLFAALLACPVMAVTLAAMRPGDPPDHFFRITLGLRDQQPASWNGQVAAIFGEVTALTGWRFEGGDAVEGTRGWKCRTHEYIAPGQRNPIQRAPGQPQPPPAAKQPWPNGVTLTVRGAAPTVTLTLPRGEVKFAAADMHLGEPRTYFDGSVQVERLPATALAVPPAPMPTEGAVEPDYPAFWVRYKTGKHYLAWVAYQGGKDRVLLKERDGPEGAWSEPVEVAGAGDHFRVALASTHDDTLWVVWASQRDKNWDLFGRPYKDGKVGAEVRLTSDPGPDLWHVMTTDHRGRAWLVWQGFRDGQSDVFARCADADGWHEPVRISTSKANDWAPTVAADSKEDRVWIGWDTYDTGNYSVRVRSLSGGPTPQLGEVLSPEGSPLFQANASLACDRDGRLWLAWEESGPQWGKDTGYLYPDSPATRLYHSRRLRVKVLEKGRWLEPAAELNPALPGNLNNFHEAPQLQPDSDGRMWLAFRHPVARNPRADDWAANGGWHLFATAYLGDRWLAPFMLENSAGRKDMPVSTQRDRAGNVYFAYASDNRPWIPPGMQPRNYSVSVSRLGGAPKPGDMRLVERSRPAVAAVAPVHPREAEQVARIRGYKVEAGGKTYHIYRGDLHRHTDLSGDGVGDGSIRDLHRYGLDAAGFDYIMVTDHNMGQDNEYNWWRTQKANDLYTVPGAFISMYGYERSVPYPNGHRNVIWAQRGHRTLKLPRVMFPKEMAEDTQKLYADLRRTDGICTLHTSATGQGTNWEEKIDGSLEPFVEIFQGFHGSFEEPNGPKAITDKSDIIHTSFKPDGYVVLALDKGYRLGFQASSDHVSTHVSYACILAEDFSRQGLIDAMRKRHSYAATDNIVLDVRMGNALMGDEVRTRQPSLDVVALGTGPIDRVDVVRNGEPVHSIRPEKDAAEVRFHWEDRKPVQGEKASYYYVRVTQKDGQVAWGSPIWVQVGP